MLTQQDLNDWLHYSQSLNPDEALADKVHTYLQLLNDPTQLADSDFDWLLEADRKAYFDKFLADHKTLPASLFYGIPGQVDYDPLQANVLLCLHNPALGIKDANKAAIYNNLPHSLSAYRDAAYVDPESAKPEKEYFLREDDNPLLQEAKLIAPDNTIYRELQEAKRSHPDFQLDDKHTSQVGYYTKTYFNGLLRDVVLTAMPGASQEEISTRIKALPLSKCELCIYRSQHSYEIMNDDIAAAPSSAYICSLVIARIVKALVAGQTPADGPIVVLREKWTTKNPRWSIAMKKVLEATNTNITYEAIKPFLWAMKNVRKATLTPGNVVNLVSGEPLSTERLKQALNL